MEWALALVALALLGVAAVSRRLAGTPLTPAILFVAFGLLVGPQVLDGIDLSSSGTTVRALAETTLALVLFSDASRIDLGALRRTVGVPLRLLGIGLPLTIAVGAAVAAAVFDVLTLGEAVILAVVLAPTDAALGQAVVTHPRVPQRIRQGLNVESGLNDGICVPLLFAAVAIADVESEISHGRSPGTLLLEEIGYGVLGGVVAGFLIAAIVTQAGRRELITASWRQVISVAGAALAYGLASALDGSGFIAAFVAGMVFRLALRRDPEELNQLTEELGAVLNGVTFVLFGAILLGPALSDLTWQLAVYALLSLTLVRMLPVVIAMWGSHARGPTLGFVGWFGPRGLASIVFAVIVVEESNLPHETLIVHTIYLTVGLSVLAHGLTAAPLADRYARWYQQHPSGNAPPMESAPVEVTRPPGPARQPTEPSAAASAKGLPSESRHTAQRSPGCTTEPPSC
jgi:NhaP-type Na+/H+ or K+/H+ antiporter